MGVKGISKFIFELYASEVAEIGRYHSSPEEVLRNYDITSDEKKTILAKDYASLYCFGLHPVLISHIVQINELASNVKEAYTKEYFSKIRECVNPYQHFYEISRH